MRIGKPILISFALCAGLLSAQAAVSEQAAAPEQQPPADTPAPRFSYPTQDRVGYVIDCMHKLGGANYTTMYKCSCAIDEIADQIPYRVFIVYDTFLRGRHTSGERQDVLREGIAAHTARVRYAKVIATAADHCLIDNPGFIPQTRGGDEDKSENEN